MAYDEAGKATEQFNIISSNLNLLAAAKNTAIEYAKKQINQNTVGIAFLGAIARGYFDEASDIDISIFEKGSEKKYETETLKYNGFDVHYFKVDYETELGSNWDTGKRWAYSNVVMFYDPANQLQALLENKVPLKDEERRWFLMSGITLSEWHVNRLTELWIKRGSILSAHYMINEGINYFLNALFALNNELTADYKWRIHCAAQLKMVPSGFLEKVGKVLEVREITLPELARRKRAFMEMWESILPEIEAELKMKFAEFKNLV